MLRHRRLRRTEGDFRLSSGLAMPNCTTTQKTLTYKIRFFFTIFHQCTIYVLIIQHLTHSLSQISLPWIGWRTILVYYLIKLAWLINLIHSVYTQPNKDNSVPYEGIASLPLFLWRLYLFIYLVSLISQPY